MDSPRYRYNFGGIMGNLSSPGGALFRTLIAAKDAPFSVSFEYFARGPDFNPGFGPSLAAIR